MRLVYSILFLFALSVSAEDRKLGNLAAYEYLATFDFSECQKNAQRNERVDSIRWSCDVPQDFSKFDKVISSKPYRSRYSIDDNCILEAFANLKVYEVVIACKEMPNPDFTREGGLRWVKYFLNRKPDGSNLPLKAPVQYVRIER